MDYQSTLSTTIAITAENLLNVLAKIHFEDRQKKTIEFTGGKASVRDIIAYQIGWGKLLISWYEAGIRGEAPEMPGEGFTSLDYVGLAQHFYTKYSYESPQEQEEVFKQVVARIIEIAEKEHKMGNLEKIGVWSWCTLKSGKQWPLSKWITVNTVAPYKRAIALIKKLQ